MKNVSALLVASLLTSCVTTSVVSNVSPNLKGPYHSMTVVMNTSARAKDFIGPFNSRLQKELALRGTTADVLALGALSLISEKEVNEKINGSKSEAVMIISQTESSAYGGVGMGLYKGSNGGVFDVKIFAGSPDNMVWRGRLEAFGDYGIEMASSSATEKFIAKLEQDGVISKVLANKP